MAQVTFTAVSKSYPGGVHALHAVTLSVESGEVMVLAGPSGAGKTTMLRLVAGLEPPSAGEVRIQGTPAAALPPHARGVGLLSQRPVLYPHLSVFENLCFGIPSGWGWQPRFHPDFRAHLNHLTGVLGLRELLDRRPGQLSAGQQQRVALGRALARQPRLLLLDEPFTSLDGPLRLELRHQLHLLQRHLAATMIVVTHEQDEAVGLADRVAVFEAGRLVQVGTPRDVAEHPHTAFAAWLLKGT